MSESEKQDQSPPPGAGRASDALSGVTGRPGWFTRDAILARYAERTNADLRGITVARSSPW